MMRLHGTMAIGENNHLYIGGVDTTRLAAEYGTPLYVMDQQLIQENIKKIKSSFTSKQFETEVIYASKAFINSYFCNLIAREGLSLDTLSSGDLYVAEQAGFPMDRIYLHGNAKSIDELERAVDCGIRRIVVDNPQEYHKLNRICRDRGQKVSVLLRLNPGIEAHTHAYIQTADNDSKFGISIFSEDIFDTIENLLSDEFVDLKGVHCHIGSQIFQESSYHNMIDVMTDFIAEVKRRTGHELTELNLGGGFGIYYAGSDSHLDLSLCLQAMVRKLEQTIEEKDLHITRVMIEPGRSIVGNAGTTLYSVEGTKTTHSGKHYVFIDGGMADNIRPALYQAVYEAGLASNVSLNDGEEGKRVCVAGKCCESGDKLVDDLLMGPVEHGDIVAVTSTGAYNYTMSSRYNNLRRPAVVMVKDGAHVLTTRRERLEQLIENDVCGEILC